MGVTIHGRRFLLSLFLVALLIPSGVALAEESEIVPQPGRARPNLAGHSFVENNIVPSPFVRTFIRNQLGMGKVQNIEIIPPEINGEPINGLTGDLMFAILDLEYQYAIREWVALRASFRLVGRMGTDAGALLAEGVTMTSGFEMGWLVRLREGEKTSLGLDLGMTNRSFTGVNLAQFVDDVIAGNEASLVEKAPSMRGFAGVRYSWAASTLVGVTASGLLGYGEPLDRTMDSEFFTRLGAAVDFDIAGKTSLPLGAVLGYSYDSMPEVSTDISNGLNTWLFRISYMGRQDFLLSLDFSWESFSRESDGRTFNGSTLGFNMRYYF